MAVHLQDEFPAPRRARVSESDPLARRLRLHDSRGRLSDTFADIEADVVAALGRGQFSLLYQPRFSLRSGDVVAVEALLRWHDSVRGLLSPKAFLPLVAVTDAMVALGQWVLAEASREAAQWEQERPAGATPITVSVNVEAREVLEPGFVDGVLLVLEERALPSRLLQLELDASDPLRGEALVLSKLQHLRDKGIRVAIDGASPQLGAGSMLLDVDSVHLDRRWVRGIGADEGLAHAVGRLVDSVHQAGGTVCATGVETVEQSDALASVGCDYAQGYLFCDPVPAEALGWLDT